MKLKVYVQNETLEEFEDEINESIEKMEKDGYFPIDFKSFMEPTQGVLMTIMFNKSPVMPQIIHSGGGSILCKKEKNIGKVI